MIIDHRQVVSVAIDGSAALTKTVTVASPALSIFLVMKGAAALAGELTIQVNDIEIYSATLTTETETDVHLDAILITGDEVKATFANTGSVALSGFVRVA
mgnify:CR=1 FL=1